MSGKYSKEQASRFAVKTSGKCISTFSAHIESFVAGHGVEEITAKVYRYDIGLLNFLGIPQGESQPCCKPATIFKLSRVTNSRSSVV